MEHSKVPTKVPIYVAVADNTRVHSQLIAEGLKRDRQIMVSGAVSTSSELLEIATKLPISVALISCVLDEEPLRGFVTLRDLQVLRPEVRGVILLDSSKRETVVEAFRAGAKGVFSRQGDIKNLCKCVRRVHEGQVWASSKELESVVEALALAHHHIHPSDSRGLSLLSKRELAVVQCLAEGLTNQEIGDRLGISKHTVKNYLLRIFDKVGASNRTELLFLAFSSQRATRQFTANESQPQAALSLQNRGTQRGLTEAQFRMAQRSAAGIGVPKDPVAAYMWCVMSEQTNLKVRDQITTLKNRIAESMTREQMLAAEAATSKGPENLITA